MTVFKGKKSSGVVPVTKGIFEEMKSRRRVSNKFGGPGCQHTKHTVCIAVRYCLWILGSGMMGFVFLNSQTILQTAGRVFQIKKLGSFLRQKPVMKKLPFMGIG
ncbi:Hypothetical predicted protein [Olea europaea subsp. europaea]|uniref:Uncharacterized protein n=1 Tax=Olea europaea subsp. europaea TaxID=158383 RepID=A0A8S0QF30_OLEEU|nr:Hypothetical predicted protein [Olea europaea subsp. europaea]